METKLSVEAQGDNVALAHKQADARSTGRRQAISQALQKQSSATCPPLLLVDHKDG